MSTNEILLYFLMIISIFSVVINIIIYFKSVDTYKKMHIENTNRTQVLEHRNIIEPNVVVIGGGTGQSVFLRGLKQFTKNISAVVTVADDGGGSGVLREDLGMLPPGDIRNCLLALANIEPTMSEVMQYRFKDGALKGQSFGNLFLAAMNGLYDNFETATFKMGEVFAITGRVMPVTLEDINLIARLSDGSVVNGESEIPRVCRKGGLKITEIWLDKPDAKPLKEVLNAIELADIIVMGPGSLYTSVIPNLLVDGVFETIKKSPAPKVYISNIMTQPGETDGYNVLDHVKAINKHTGGNIFDYVISNNELLPEDIKERYGEDGATQVILTKDQEEELNKMGITCVDKNILEVKSGYIRHEAIHLSRIITKIGIRHGYAYSQYKE